MNAIVSSVAPAEQPPRRPIDMGALGMFLQSIGSYVGPEMVLSPGKDLFHYTTLEGMLGILQNGDLWLTDSRYCNDDEEMVHGHRVATAIVNDELAIAVDPMKRQYLEQLKMLIDKPASQGVYICCFCHRDNLLSQWRGYGSSGNGVSLQIEAGAVGYLMGADCPHGLMRLWRVSYKPDEQRKIVTAALTHSFGSGGTTEEMAQRAADAIQFFIPTFKNPDFAEEKEWRIIFTPNIPCAIEPCFRVKGALLAPYYSLRELSAPMGVVPPPPLQFPVQHVTVGPAANKALNVISVRMLLEKLGYAAISVEASATPFRS